MNHFALPRRSCRWTTTTLTAVAGLSFSLSSADIAYSQVPVVAAPVTVALTPAAFLPVLSGGSSQTTIATNLDGNASPSPWQISLLSIARTDDASGQTYQVEMTNVSSKPLSLPVGTDGQAIWDACQNGEIDEVNIALRVSGQIAPAANLPAVHSCAGVPASSLTVAPGASVIFSGTLPNTILAPVGASISAVVSVCSASYSVDGSDPVATRRCQVPAVSNSAAADAAVTRTPGRVVPPRVAAPRVAATSVE
jgi:hypothetical protein